MREVERWDERGWERWESIRWDEKGSNEMRELRWERISLSSQSVRNSFLLSTPCISVLLAFNLHKLTYTHTNTHTHTHTHTHTQAWSVLRKGRVWSGCWQLKVLSPSLSSWLPFYIFYSFSFLFFFSVLVVAGKRECLLIISLLESSFLSLLPASSSLWTRQCMRPSRTRVWGLSC
jgi:hypothetical protein